MKWLVAGRSQRLTFYCHFHSPIVACDARESHSGSATSLNVMRRGQSLSLLRRNSTRFGGYIWTLWKHALESQTAPQTQLSVRFLTEMMHEKAFHRASGQAIERRMIGIRSQSSPPTHENLANASLDRALCLLTQVSQRISTFVGMPRALPLHSSSSPISSFSILTCFLISIQSLFFSRSESSSSKRLISQT